MLIRSSCSHGRPTAELPFHGGDLAAETNELSHDKVLNDPRPIHCSTSRLAWTRCLPSACLNRPLAKTQRGGRITRACATRSDHYITNTSHVRLRDVEPAERFRHVGRSRHAEQFNRRSVMPGWRAIWNAMEMQPQLLEPWLRWRSISRRWPVGHSLDQQICKWPGTSLLVYGGTAIPLRLSLVINSLCRDIPVSAAKHAARVERCAISCRGGRQRR
jgi:hypothetical protein